MAKNDPLFERIEAYSEKQGGGVIIRRANKGYSLLVEEDEALDFIAEDPYGCLWI